MRLLQASWPSSIATTSSKAARAPPPPLPPPVEDSETDNLLAELEAQLDQLDEPAVAAAEKSAEDDEAQPTEAEEADQGQDQLAAEATSERAAEEKASLQQTANSCWDRLCKCQSPT